MYKRNEFHKNEEGQSLVEFALVLPILLIIILGMIEFGWVLNAHISLTSAAREGARIAAVTTIDYEDKVKDAVVNTLEGTSGVTVIEVVYDTESDSINDIYNVIITVKGKLDPIIGLFFRNTQYIDATAIMRLE